MGEIVALEARGKEGDGIGPPRTQGPARQVDFVAEFAGGVTHALRGFGLDVILASQAAEAVVAVTPASSPTSFKVTIVTISAYHEPYR